MKRPETRPHRPSITDAPTPETIDEWNALIWETIDELVTGHTGSYLHLSAHTFPGGDADEGDGPTPLCGAPDRVGSFRRVEDVWVYPPGSKHFCDNCRDIFEFHHDKGYTPETKRPAHQDSLIGWERLSDRTEV